MDELTWTDPQLKARYERNLKAMEQRRAAQHFLHLEYIHAKKLTAAKAEQ